MKTILTIPIRVEAFVAHTTESVVTTTDDFHRLPYVNRQHLDVRFDVANLTSSINSKPLNSYRQLPRGVHMHWKMPAIMSDGELGAEGLDLPEVPNRWLIRRTGWKATKCWIVESDYLYPSGIVPDRAIAIPALNDALPGDPPYQYMGRQLSLDQWQSESQTTKQSHRYLPRLTTSGWGSPTFASLYPDCFSVFGFYDEDLIDAGNYDQQYEIFGWYSEEDRDFVNTRLKKQSDLQKFIQKAAWEIPEGELNSMDRMICYGKVVFDGKANFKTTATQTQPILTMAKSPNEVVATYLSKRHGVRAEAIKLENQILSLLFNEQVEGKDIDHVNRLKAARHQAEFLAVSGGHHWTLAQTDDFVQGIDDEVLRDRIKQELEQKRKSIVRPLRYLNQLQDRLNCAREKCAYHRRMLYNEWSQYLLTLHPVDLQGDYYPDVDMIRLLMQDQTIPALETSIEVMEGMQYKVALQVGQLELDFKEWTKDIPSDELPEKLLQLVPGPRYWKPRDPCLLISGEVIREPVKPQGKLKGHVYTSEVFEPIDWLLDPSVLESWHWDLRAINQWNAQPWNPLLVEWSINHYPEEKPHQTNYGKQSDYPSDFISRDYRIPLNDEQFGLPSAGHDLHRDRGGSLKTSTQPAVIKGRSLLNASNVQLIKRRMIKFLSENQLEESISYAGREVLEQLRAVVSTLDQDGHQLIDLDGFHNQLLLYSDMTMMEVQDPFMFKDPGHLHITQKITGLLNDHSFLLPSIGNPFTPIKSGITKLSSLQVVDNFGRTRPISCEHLNKPGRDTIGNTTYAAPRLVQPARMSFRWIDNLKHEGATPIQGWLGYNLLDETVQFFEEAGAFLGMINSDGEWTNDKGIIQSLATQINRPLRELILKCLSFHHHNRIIKSTFLAQPAASEQQWQKLVKLGVLRELAADKGLLIPFSKENWDIMVAPELSLTYDESRILLGQSKSNSNYWPKLKKAIRRAIDNIEPTSATTAASPGMIKPLAIVKAELDLQTIGGVEKDKSWSALSELLIDNESGTRNYEYVKFPLKLGEFNNLDDGLVGYWHSFVEDRLSADGFFPQSDMDDQEGFIDAASFDRSHHDYVDQIRNEGVANLTHSFADSPTSVLMIIDPEAPVHVTTGILPKKSLQLPAESYQEGIKAISARFFLAPLLTPSVETSMALPGDGDWQMELPTGNTQMPFTTLMDRDRVIKHDFLKNGATLDDWQWLLDQEILEISEGQADQAWIDLPDETLEDASQERWFELKHKVMPVIKKGLVPWEASSLTDNRIEVIEGWLSRP